MSQAETQLSKEFQDMSWSDKLHELDAWDRKILERVSKFGLDPFPQEFEICDHDQMLGYMAYSGMPSHYPHWSFGKAYEKLETIYRHGHGGLPYEMVINSNPALAYLMRDNSLTLHILTIAHVYAHNDFFKNSPPFRSTRPEFTIETLKARANRVRSYVEDPSIGIEKVEPILNAAHALSMQCRRNLLIKKLDREEQLKFIFEKFKTPYDPFFALHKVKQIDNEELKKALQKNPLEPEEDILLFIRDNNHRLEDWQKDLLTIVHESTQNFIPQIETKIMNEGWASFWHREILQSLDLPQELYIEFLVRHNQVLRPHPGGLNPYHVGLTVWDSLRIFYDFALDLSAVSKEYAERVEALKAEKVHADLVLRMQEDFEERDTIPHDIGKKTGFQKIFEVRAETIGDVPFLRRYLTPVLMGDLAMFSHKPGGEDEQFVYREVDQVANKHTWQNMRDMLLMNIGMNTVPVIKLEDSRANLGSGEVFYLKHYHDGRDLHAEYTEKTMKYVEDLWMGNVALETILGNHIKKFFMSGGKLTVK